MTDMTARITTAPKMSMTSTLTAATVTTAKIKSTDNDNGNHRATTKANKMRICWFYVDSVCDKLTQQTRSLEIVCRRKTHSTSS